MTGQHLAGLFRGSAVFCGLERPRRISSRLWRSGGTRVTSLPLGNYYEHHGDSPMADQRDKGRQNTHDTGSQQSRPRDDLRTASKKPKPNEKRDEQRDKKDDEKKAQNEE